MADQLEIIARGICEAHGMDPDALVQLQPASAPFALWHRYRKSASEIWAHLQRRLSASSED